ncbi:hypothetical protein SAMN04487851_11412 [Prevotella sp. tc2-28]|uniref:hypothetical protein n=1 Tax=Prevotella sp. tc2-28 TaxID=1761888 RepID=UPI00089C0D01|nr:hypothetical protein [Prevotella sp. tc2-28]SEA78620.1 hypothetical protein SAMN04487851_11412 [Prevotella sp. tc2-28]
MKSIKEFATEYAQDKYLPVQTSQAVKAGANYVLDEVECILEEYKLSDCEEICNELIALVGQLKK